MTTVSSSTRIPGCAGARIAAAGKEWDAVRTDRFLGLQAVDRLGAAAGPVIVEPAAVYFLVPAGGTKAWDLPQSKGLGTGHYVVLPAADRTRPPGPYWLLPPDRPLAAVDDVRRALKAAAALVLLDLDTVQHDTDHALSHRVELPRRSVIDAGTDALVHHLRRLMSYNYGPPSEESTGIQMRTLCVVAERNLAAPVRPTPQTNHRVAYVYWNTLATLTAAFRDLYLAHRPTEPGQRT
ncbi:hypothetical protein [Streptomyces sp. W4I9-2]|uniref:hypothetical protein n=1 Tax=Streptomyces sp. W4I9-2 TaxID=3042297 RepID=UPI0027867282|nr:hypothetical protein [Streptomyces sp. W4I9-2]MDQ0693576.1 hypothetical protein [Streptomyces sp. W4I9-2]